MPRKWEVFEDFNEAAKLYWNENRSLELIADISSRQIDILEGNGYSKIDQIPKIIESNFSKLSSTSFDKLKRQANAQLLSTENETHVELKMVKNLSTTCTPYSQKKSQETYTLI